MTTTATAPTLTPALTATTPRFRLCVTSHPTGRTVLLEGEFDAETADLVAVVVGHVLRSGQDVVLDLADVPFCDVRACNALFSCARDAVVGVTGPCA